MSSESDPTPAVPPSSEPVEEPYRPVEMDVSFRASEFAIEVSVSHARAHLPELLDGIRDGAMVYLTRYGKRLAAMVPADAGEYLERVEDEYWSKRAGAVLSSNPTFVPLDEAIASWEAQDA
jgi:antitoxin (DNA-binding transcriptional repressor) of toxin-antitoxin stability system